MLEYLTKVSFPIVNEDKKMLEICFPDAKCNMNCKYCFGNHKTRPCNNSRSLDREVLRKAIEPLKNEISFVHLWAGELLYNKEFFLDAVSFVHEVLPGKQINIVSNGLLLPEWVDFLIENHINVALSHDGPGQKYRGFDYLKSEAHINAILRLAEVKLFDTFKIVIHNKNCNFKKINNYFAKFNSKYNLKIFLEHLLIQSNDVQAYVFKPKDYPTLEKNLIWKIKDILKNLNDEAYIKCNYARGEVLEIMNAADLITNKPVICLPKPCMGTSAISFTSDGKRVPCHCFVEKDSNIQELKLDLEAFFKDCIGCEVAPLCNGGCLANSSVDKKITCEFSYFYYSTIIKTVKAAIDELTLEGYKV